MANQKKSLDIAHIARLYAQGRTQAQIASQLGTTQTTIANRMHQAGIVTRRPGSAPGDGKPYPTAAERKAIAKQYASGDSGQVVAEAHGVTVSTVYRCARTYEVPVRGGCRHADRNSAAYADAVVKLAKALGEDFDFLLEQLADHGLTSYERPSRKFARAQAK